MAMHRQAPRCFSAGPTGSTAGDGLRAELLLDGTCSRSTAVCLSERTPPGERAAAVSAERRLAERAIAGVMRNAQAGELPLYAWTLGLPQDQLLRMIQAFFPELGALERMPRAQYRRLAAALPAGFAALVGVLLAGRGPGRDAQTTWWLAHAVAAACEGSRSLREDLGLTDEDELSRLLAGHFAPLARSRPCGCGWKDFLIERTRAHHALPGPDAPACGR